MLDGTLMLRVNLPVVGIIYLKSNTFVTGVKIKATGDSKINDSPVDFYNITLQTVLILHKSVKS